MLKKRRAGGLPPPHKKLIFEVKPMSNFRDDMLKEYEIALKTAQEKKETDRELYIDNERTQTQKATGAITDKIKNQIKNCAKSNVVSYPHRTSLLSKKRGFFNGYCRIGVGTKEVTGKDILSVRFSDYRFKTDADGGSSYNADFGIYAPMPIILEIAGNVYDILINDGLICFYAGCTGFIGSNWNIYGRDPRSDYNYNGISREAFISAWKRCAKNGETLKPEFALFI